MNIDIMDIVVYKQNRQLPLRLRKEYQRQPHFLKKYTEAAEQGGILKSRIALDHPLDGASTDGMEYSIINIGWSRKRTWSMDKRCGRSYAMSTEEYHDVWVLNSTPIAMAQNVM